MDPPEPQPDIPTTSMAPKPHIVAVRIHFVFIVLEIDLRCLFRFQRPGFRPSQTVPTLQYPAASKIPQTFDSPIKRRALPREPGGLPSCSRMVGRAGRPVLSNRPVGVRTAVTPAPQGFLQEAALRGLGPAGVES